MEHTRGMCKSPSTLFQYFQISLNIRKNKNYDFLAILNVVGLNPQKRKDLVSQNILNPILKATEKKPNVCDNNNRITRKCNCMKLHYVLTRMSLSSLTALSLLTTIVHLDLCGSSHNRV